MNLSALLSRQLGPVRQWRCEEIDCVLLHGDDLLLESSKLLVIKLLSISL